MYFLGGNWGMGNPKYFLFGGNWAPGSLKGLHDDQDKD